MTLAVTIMIGLAIGVMVELLLPGHTFSELLLAMLLGVAGALVARFFGQRTGFYGTDEPASVMASVIGSIVVLLLYGVLFRRKRLHR